MPSFNAFDVAVYVCLLIAFITGFNSGLLRSLATIFGYLVAMALVVAAAPFLLRLATEQWHLPPLQNWIVLLAVFLIAGVIISVVLRYAVSELAGPEVGPIDRMLGAVLGADSKLRPILSAAGRQGLRSLPPEIESYVDRLKRERGL
jgi:membrane protein required for colicin V production